MPRSQLEDRVAALEHQLAELRAVVERSQQGKDWRSTVGIFTGDEGMIQVFEEALKLREADRARARRRYAKQRQKKK
jgi:hypothetical protein